MAEIVLTMEAGEGSVQQVRRETAADFAARMAEERKDVPQIWATFSDDPDPKLVGIRFSSVRDWRIALCQPSEEVMTRLRGQRQLLSVVAEEPLGWFVELTDVHDQFNEAPLDLSLDSDVRGVFWVVNHHCWGEAEAERLETLLEQAQIESWGPQYPIEDLLRMPNTRKQ